MSWSYKIALGADLIALAVALYFIISDYIKYSSYGNGSLGWVTLIFSAWLGTSYYLYHHGHPGIASAMAWVPAIPIIGYGLFVLMFIILKPDMR